MCSCNSRSNHNPRTNPRNARTIPRGVDGVSMDSRHAVNRHVNVAGQMPVRQNFAASAQPVNYDRIRIEKLRRDAINQANRQNK